jgi:hypothetical protein
MSLIANLTTRSILGFFVSSAALAAQSEVFDITAETFATVRTISGDDQPAQFSIVAIQPAKIDTRYTVSETCSFVEDYCHNEFHVIESQHVIQVIAQYNKTVKMGSDDSTSDYVYFNFNPAFFSCEDLEKINGTQSIFKRGANRKIARSLFSISANQYSETVKVVDSIKSRFCEPRDIESGQWPTRVSCHEKLVYMHMTKSYVDLHLISN